jgi:hypothetical protein
MKNFKETFDLISGRLHNLKGMIKTTEYCILQGQSVDYHTKNLVQYKKEQSSLIEQDNDIRNFIINEK